MGCGDMEDAHQQVFAGLGDRITVIGTADVVLARAEHAAQALGAPRAVTDYTELLDDADACLIVTPHDLHYEMGMRCLRAGKHVLMEKPMAVSEEQCLDLIHAASTAERQLMTAYPMRFHPLVAHLRELVAAEAYGEVIQVSVYTEQHTEHPEGHWIRSAARLGGGQLFSHGCHYVDLLLWMLGEPVRGTHTGTRRGTPWMEWEGTSNAVIEFASGALGYHFGTWGARATRHGYAIHVHCEKGMLEADLTRGLLYAHHPWAGEAPRGGLSGRLSPDPEHAEVLMAVPADSKHLGGELVHFVDCLDSGASPLTDGPGSLQGLRVIWRLYEAERRGVVADLRGLGLSAEWDRPGLAGLPLA
ncbi:Gfo/Idh/MocA family protein [Phytohabitans flavus]|uniref:Gfo/Idh/MocA family protein n=1 Tax=Phytohabitans flavus TaxID=1076124 RepID=UPI0022B2967C|nr:Gfo/Idh/MocA family oxidoreductase [Phytohabitans flavus]